MEIPLADFDFRDRIKGLVDSRGYVADKSLAPVDYTSQLDVSTVRQNPLFLDDLRRYYESRGVSGKSDDELFNLLLDDSNVRAFNTFAPFFGARGSWSDAAGENSDEGRARLARLKQVAEAYPTIFSEGGRSLGEALPSIATGIATDPLNLLGVGVGAKAASRGLQIAAEGGNTARAMIEGAKTGAAMSAVAEGTIGAVAGGIASYGDQATNVELGLQPEVSTTRVVEEALISGAISGTIGALLGGASGAAASRQAYLLTDRLGQLGYTPDMITSMDFKQAKSITENNIQAPPAAPLSPESAPDPEAAAAETERLRQDQFTKAAFNAEVRLNSWRDGLRSYQASLFQERQDMVADGVNDLKIKAVDRKLSEVNKMLGVYPRIEAERQEIRNLVNSNKPEDRGEGMRRADQLERDLAQLSTYLADDVPDDMARYFNDMLTRLGLTPEEAAPPAEQRLLPGTGPDGRPAADGTVYAGDASSGETPGLPGYGAIEVPPTRELPAPDPNNPSPAPQRDIQEASARPPSGNPDGRPTADDPNTIYVEPTRYLPPPDPNAAPAPRTLADLEERYTTPPSGNPDGAPFGPPPPKARPAVAKYALAAGVDITEVAPTGSRGFVTRADVDAHIASKGPSPDLEAVANRLADTLDTLTAQIDRNLIDLILADDDAFKNIFRQYNPDVDPRFAESALRIIRNADAFSGEIPLEDLPADVFPPYYERRIKKRIKELLETNPRMTETIAAVQARDEARRAMAAPEGPAGKMRTGTTVVTRQSIDDELAARKDERAKAYRDAGLEPPAGLRNAFGRIQSFLKTGTPFKEGTDEEYSITGTRGTFSPARPTKIPDVPRADQTDFHRAILLAEESRKAGSSGIAAFRATAGTIVPADGKGFAEKDTILYADARSGKAFTDWRNIYKLHKETIPAYPPKVVQQQLEAMGVKNAKPGAPQAIRAARQAGADNASMDKAIIEAIAQGKSRAEIEAIISAYRQPATKQLDVPPLTQGGKVLLLRRKKPNRQGDHPTRLATPDAIKNGLSAIDLIGYNADLADWDVRYVAPDTIDMPMTREAAFLAAKTVEQPAPIFSNQPTPIGDFLTSRLDPSSLSTEDWRAIEAAANLMRDPERAQKWLAGARSRGVTGEALLRLISNIEGGATRVINKSVYGAVFPGWPSTRAGQTKVVALLRQLYQIQAKVAPNGILLPEADRAAAVADISSIFRKYGPEQLAQARDLISRLAGGARPVIGEGDAGGAGGLTRTMGLSGDRVGSITLSPDLSQADLPPLAVLYHEVAHWAYMNILTPEDRAQFWSAVSKYYDEGGNLSPAGVASRSPVAALSGQQVGAVNALHNPQELFANQFSMWAMQKAAESVAPATLWQKVARVIKAVFDRFFARESLDPDMEPLFSKILPESQRTAASVAPPPQQLDDGLLDFLPDAGVVTQAAPKVAPASSAPARPRATPADAVAAVRREVGKPKPAPEYPEGPLQDYLSGSLEDALASASDRRAEFVSRLHANYNTISDFERRWALASHLNDPGKAIEVARDQLRYLRGSYLTNEQVEALRIRAARSTGTAIQPQRTKKGIFSPYAQSKPHLYAGLARMKALADILAGKRLQPMDETSADVVSKAMDSLGLAFDSAGVTIDLVSVGEQLLELYRNGVKLPDGTYAFGSSLLDFMNIQKKMLNTSFERIGLPGRQQLTAKTNPPQDFMRVGKFVFVRVGDTFRVRYGDGSEVWNVVRFETKESGERVPILFNPADQTEAELTEEIAANLTRVRKAEDPVEVQAKKDAKVGNVKAARRAAKEEVAKKAVSEAKARRDRPTEKPPAPSDAPSPKAMAPSELEAVVASDTTLADRAADELVIKEQSTPVIDASAPANREQAAKLAAISEMPVEDLVTQLGIAFRSGDPDAPMIAETIMLRSPATQLVVPGDADVLLAVERELTHTIGAGRQPGIPASAPTDLAEVLRSIDERDRPTKVAARTIAYRLLNLSGEEMPSRLDVAFMLDLPLGTGSGWKGNADAPFGDVNDPLFQSFRDRIRELGRMARSGSDSSRLVFELAKMLRRTDPDGDVVEGFLPPNVSRPERAADEWLGDEIIQRMNGRASQPSTAGLDPEMVQRGEALVSRTLDRMGYVLNGLMGEGTRRDLQRLTWYGDLFRRASSPTATMIDAARFTPTQARRLIDGLQAMPIDQKQAITNWSGVRFESNTSTPVGFLSTPSTAERESLAPRSGEFGSTIVLSRAPAIDPTDEVFTAIQGLENPSDRELALAVYDDLKANESIVNEQAAASSTGTELQDLIEHEEALIDTLRELGIAYPLHTPFVARQKNPILADAVISNTGEMSIYIDAFQRAIADGSPGANIEALRRAARNFASTYLSEGRNGGRVGDLLALLADEHTKRARGSASLINGREVVNHILRRAGYDSVVTQTEIHVFSPSQLKMIDDPDFTFGVEVPDPEHPIRVSGHVARLASEVDDIPLEQLPLLLGSVSKAEPYRPITNLMASIAKKRRPVAEDLEAVLQFNRIQLRSNSRRFQSYGMNHLADWFETHFQDVTQSFGRFIYGSNSKPGPLRALQSLPDASGFVKHHLRTWARRATADAFNTRRFGLDQPESHKNILSALRKATPAAINGLSAAERGVAATIRSSLQDALRQLKEAGAMVGDLGPDYFPQVWNSTKIQKNADAFRADLREFLAQEARQDRRPITDAELDEKVRRLYLQMSDEVQGGVLHDTKGSSRSSSAENLDYARMFNLDRVTGGRELLGKYLEDDLTTILVKYFDSVALRLAQVKKFGHASHGFFDYLTAVQGGKRGIADLLINPRLNKHVTNSPPMPSDMMARLGLSEDDLSSAMGIAEEYAMPFTQRPDQAAAAVDRLLEIHSKHGPQASRNYLMSLAVPDPARNNRPSIPYERRVDAIVAALSDFGGNARTVSQDEMKFIETALHVSNRKALLGGGGRAGLTTSRAVRKFNSVTLLSWTILSSLGDPALALMRSGSPVAFTRAVKRLSLDQDYRRAINNVGVSVESLLHDRMANLWGSPDGRFTNAFFSATGLTPWTDVQRSVAGAVGLETFRAAYHKARRAYQPGVPTSQQPRAFKVGKRILERYGIGEYVNRTHFDFEKAVADDDLFRTALVRFADDAIFSPNPNEIPMWAQTPLGSVLFQLKSFPLMMARMARELLLDDLRVAMYHIRGREAPEHIKATGDLRRGMMLLTVAPLIGAGVLSIKDVLQGRGGENSNEHQLRERRFSEWAAPFGLEDMSDEDTDAFLGWYIEGMAMAGGLGLFAEMIHDVLDQADNGNYGLLRASQSVLGPSAGLVVDSWTVGTGAYDWFLDSTPEGNYPERAAARAIVRRVPVVGGMGSVREDTVDSWAGEAMSRKKQQAKDNNASIKLNPALFR